MVRSFRSEDSLSPVLIAEVRLSRKCRCVTPIESRAQSASSSGALATGLAGTDWELDFKQCSFHHIMQVLRVCRFSTFSLPPALPPCCCPLAFQHQVRRLASRISSESYPGYPECVVSCHGAGRLANSIRAFFRVSRPRMTLMPSALVYAEKRECYGKLATT